MNPFSDSKEVESGWYARFRAKVTRALSHVSLRTRITALVMVAVGASVALASVAAFITVRNQILSQVDNSLLQRGNSLAELVRDVPPGNELTVPITFLKATGTRMTLISPTNAIEYDSKVNPLEPTPADYAIAQTGSGDNFRTVITPDGTKLRVVTVPVGLNQAVMLGQSTADTQETLNRLSLVSILVGIAGIAVAGSAGITVARAGLRPVDRLTEATEYVARTGDLQPIEVQGTDELARLATSFNSMLTALARSQDHQRRLIADAGHELRTPLTSMRTNIDFLAQVFAADADGPSRISAKDRTELISDVRAQMEELSVLVGDLVELSRDVKPPNAPEPVNVADIVTQAVDRVRRRAPNLEYDIRLEPWYLNGDPATLERAVTNLLDNAAKWSPEGGTVTVQLHDGLLQVSDQGPGIAEADLPHVFERFYRSTEARTMPGSGLGLAIVRQAAENHGGRVAAARAPGGGALLGLWLPGRPSEETSDDAAVGAAT